MTSLMNDATLRFGPVMVPNVLATLSDHMSNECDLVKPIARAIKMLMCK